MSPPPPPPVNQDAFIKRLAQNISATNIANSPPLWPDWRAGSEGFPSCFTAVPLFTAAPPTPPTPSPPPASLDLTEPLEENYTKSRELNFQSVPAAQRRTLHVLRHPSTATRFPLSLHPTGKSKRPPGRVVQLLEGTPLLHAERYVLFQKLNLLALAA